MVLKEACLIDQAYFYQKITEQHQILDFGAVLL